MQIRKLIALCICALFGVLRSYGQADIHFSQFYETSILRNPSLTGVFADDYKFGVYYRNQWSSITFPYETFLASAETHVNVSHNSEDFFSFGMLGMGDKAGSLSQRITAFYPAISYNKSVNQAYHSFLSVGFTGGYIQYSFDPSKATFNSQFLGGAFDPTSPSNENLPKPQMGFFDMGAGINFNTTFGQENTSVGILGVSGYHFTQPGFSYYETPDVNLNMRWNANSALSFDLSEPVSLQIQANYALQGTYNEIVGGCLINWNAVTLGASTLFGLTMGAMYRYGDAVVPIVKIKYQNMSLGVSYDVNISSLKQASKMQGAYETTLFIGGMYPSKSGYQKRLVCPRF